MSASIPRPTRRQASNRWQPSPRQQREPSRKRPQQETGRPTPRRPAQSSTTALVARLAHRGPRIDRDLVDTQHAAFGNLSEGGSRNRRRHGHRTTRRRVVRRHVHAEACRAGDAGPAPHRTCRSPNLPVQPQRRKGRTPRNLVRQANQRRTARGAGETDTRRARQQRPKPCRDHYIVRQHVDPDRPVAASPPSIGRCSRAVCAATRVTARAPRCPRPARRFRRRRRDDPQLHAPRRVSNPVAALDRVRQGNSAARAADQGHAGVGAHGAVVGARRRRRRTVRPQPVDTPFGSGRRRPSRGVGLR